MENIDEIDDDFDPDDPFDEFKGIEVAQAVHIADGLFVGENHYALGLRSLSGDAKYVKFTRDELLSYDERLPEVLEALYAAHGYVINNALSDTIAHWDSPSAVVDIIDGSPQYLHSVSKIYPYTAGDTLELEAFVYEMSVLPSGVEYDPGGETKRLRLATAWVEANFPGAINRLHAASSLDFTDDDLINYVFSKNNVEKLASPLPSDLTP